MQSGLRFTCLLVIACSGPIAHAVADPGVASSAAPAEVAAADGNSPAGPAWTTYATVRLETDLSHLSNNQRLLLPLLIEASVIMDDLFWKQAYGDRDYLVDGLDDSALRRFAEINYGPWDRLDGDRPFLPGVGPKPAGASFYPSDMSKAEFEAAELPDKRSWYTLLRRDADGRLITLPYSDAYRVELGRAARLLARAAALADEAEFRRYLTLRAKALITDEYRDSDMAWMDMKNNSIDLVIGPIEQYEDQLFGYKTGYEAYVLLKDTQWSERLARFAGLLPELQRGLPVGQLYKAEQPGTDSDLNAYDVLYYAGHSNAGSKTIAINLPNDEVVQLAKGTRRLQLKNAMRAKFDRILTPITEVMIVADQREQVTFDAFFATTMFHEVAHGLGVKQTVTGQGTVREALREYHSTMEEGKADIVGLFMITWLFDNGYLPGTSLMDYYVTSVASTFRSIRFGASSAHAKADMVRFNFLRSYDAVTRDAETGRYRVHMDRMREAIDALSAQILVLQGNGDYRAAVLLTDDMGIVTDQLAGDLQRVEEAGIPVDVVFEQGPAVLGLH